MSCICYHSQQSGASLGLHEGGLHGVVGQDAVGESALPLVLVARAHRDSGGGRAALVRAPRQRTRVHGSRLAHRQRDAGAIRHENGLKPLGAVGRAVEHVRHEAGDVGEPDGRVRRAGGEQDAVASMR